MGIKKSPAKRVLGGLGKPGVIKKKLVRVNVGTRQGGGGQRGLREHE